MWLFFNFSAKINWRVKRLMRKINFFKTSSSSFKLSSASTKIGDSILASTSERFQNQDYFALTLKWIVKSNQNWNLTPKQRRKSLRSICNRKTKRDFEKVSKYILQAGVSSLDVSGDFSRSFNPILTRGDQIINLIYLEPIWSGLIQIEQFYPIWTK